MSPTPAYETMLDRIAAAIRAEPLSLVLIDGIPASGKSSLARALASRLQSAGRDAIVVENDWFLAPAIRSPRQIVSGLALALSRRPIDDVERGLLDRFLDGERLGHFQDELARATRDLASGQTTTLAPRGAHWNLAASPDWQERVWTLRPGAVVIIEGTLCRATYLDRFPESLCLSVDVPVPQARGRFIQRNKATASRRNFAFSLLALVGPAYGIAADMIGRDRHNVHLRIDLSDLSAPTVQETDSVTHPA